MPFDIDFTVPADTALISGYPAAERAMRADLQGWIIVNHNEQTGKHVFLSLEQGADNDDDEPGTDGTHGFLYAQDIGGETELHYKSDADQVVIITEDGVIAPLALPKAGGTMTGILLMDGATIDLKNLTEKIRLEIVAGSTFRNGLFIDAADKINVGDENEPLWLVASASGRPQEAADDDKGFIAVYPGGPDNERFWHEGNDGALSTLDADLLDGVEAEEIFADINDNTGSGFFFQSVGQSVAINQNSSNIAHLLDAQPSLITGTLRCTDADLEYSIGDEVALTSGGDSTRRISFGADDTNCFYHIGTAKWRLNRKSANTEAQIDSDNWELIIRVWK